MAKKSWGEGWRFRDQRLQFRCLVPVIWCLALAGTGLAIGYQRSPAGTAWPQGQELGQLALLSLLLGYDAVGTFWRSGAGQMAKLTLTEAITVPTLLVAPVPVVATIVVVRWMLRLAALPPASHPLRWYFLATSLSADLVVLTVGAGALTGLTSMAGGQEAGPLAQAAAVAVATAAAALTSFLLVWLCVDTAWPGRLQARGFLTDLQLQLILLPCFAVGISSLGAVQPVLSLAMLGTLAAVSEIARQVGARQDAERRAGTDLLTGLGNHQLYWSTLSTVLAGSQRRADPCANSAVLLLDIDDFKAINDTHGHLTGDECLKAVARALTEAVRASDATFRYGGEEFAVVLPDATGDQALLTADRVLQAVRQCHPVGLTTSIGVAVATGPATTAIELTDHADQAMYQAKRSGKDRAVLSLIGVEAPAASLSTARET